MRAKSRSWARRARRNHWSIEMLPKREVESRELGDMGGFDMDVEGENTQVSVSKKIKIASLTVAGRHVNMLVQTSTMAMLVNAPHPRKEVYGHLRGELLEPLLVRARRSRERA